MNVTLDSLNQSFAVPGLLHVAAHGSGLPVVDIHTPQASARLALQGAQLLAWQPTGAQPVLWVSDAAVVAPGKGVRGGVPVCWPWFGARDGLPAHGLVRTRLWQLLETRQDASGQVVVRLGLSDDAATRALWPHAFELELVVTVGATLTMALVTRNSGTTAFTITDALHTYFAVTDITQTTVHGLDGCTYLDKLQNFAACQQTGAVVFSGETDRVYVPTASTCLIDDAAGQRRICVSKQGSASTVVWNPWHAREKAFADMATGDYRHMLCVETCNAGPDEITLPPGATHTLLAHISVT